MTMPNAVALVIDDEPVLTDVIARILEQSSISVLETTSPTTGLDLARTGKPHVALIGYAMPESDGITLARGITDASPRTKIIIWNEPVPVQQQQALHDEALGWKFLSMPSEPAEIVNCVEEMLMHHLVCPTPMVWNAVYQDLKGAASGRSVEGLPVPLILGAWWVTTDADKADAWSETLQWAVTNDLAHMLPKLTAKQMYLSDANSRREKE